MESACLRTTSWMETFDRTLGDDDLEGRARGRREYTWWIYVVFGNLWIRMDVKMVLVDGD